MTDIEQLQEKIKVITAERNKFHAELTDLKLQQLRTDVDDHENRVRALETIATRSNTLYALATGGGIVSVIVLFRTLLQIP